MEVLIQEDLIEKKYDLIEKKNRPDAVLVKYSQQSNLKTLSDVLRGVFSSSDDSLTRCRKMTLKKGRRFGQIQSEK
jgi:hypothetical protein